MKIGELADATGTPVVTVRFYEQQGLLPIPARTSSNYRIYGGEHVDRLAFIRHCRTLDMTLEEIRLLLEFKDAPQADCGAVNALLDAHIDHVAERIAELKSLEKQLKALRSQCEDIQAGKDCGILSTLVVSARTPAAKRVHEHVHGAHPKTPRAAK
ncbi:Cd(II)/Pb(II)-responsive transcriptional regulator [Piscinibacter gummiphilus]|uniref:Cd(II)/Pb(II)-responsive transcriptional regulator n=1 Tax=Piscinibacter gummiphilus TaxID=946333 RepID=A0ABZ0D175_9BURK|nr:Cd(II)/Pb(II)-responsive transcriptional regulator [Piscinibacter gummiphilus]WOB10939.1 Cd(II)/Pb(II)-responsive transcriptional regulator [Piscinibacter gummiphilus]